MSTKDDFFRHPYGIWPEMPENPEKRRPLEKHKFLRPALWGWVTVNRRYCQVVENDSIYWCNERSNVGALAAGAWREGMVALEEYTDEKKGRPDLYIADIEGVQDALIEAKLHWWGRDKEKELRVRINKACDQVTRRHERDADLKIGAVFVVPDLRVGSHNRFAHPALINDLRRDYQPDILAWYFDRENARLEYKDKDGTYRCPGVVLMMKICNP